MASREWCHFGTEMHMQCVRQWKKMCARVELEGDAGIDGLKSWKLWSVYRTRLIVLGVNSSMSFSSPTRNPQPPNPEFISSTSSSRGNCFHSASSHKHISTRHTCPTFSLTRRRYRCIGRGTNPQSTRGRFASHSFVGMLWCLPKISCLKWIGIYGRRRDIGGNGRAY